MAEFIYAPIKIDQIHGRSIEQYTKSSGETKAESTSNGSASRLVNKDTIGFQFDRQSDCLHFAEIKAKGRVDLGGFAQVEPIRRRFNPGLNRGIGMDQFGENGRRNVHIAIKHGEDVRGTDRDQIKQR